MKESMETTLLDSSLISKLKSNQLSNISYQYKVYDCGDYVQIYKFQNTKYKKDSSFIDLKKIDNDNLYKKENINKPKSILLSNAIRSNLSVQRLARSNFNIWESFITLTFSTHITDISIANKKFNQFISNVRRIKIDFKYLAVPEFMKNGRVHYHLLSNLILDDVIIKYQKNKKGRAVNIDSLYDIRFWSYGFCRVDFVKSNYKKIFSYLTKYMTKDIDNKLFGKKRYFYSQNLKKPVVNFVNNDNFNYLSNLLINKSICFKTSYIDSYTKSNIEFLEFKKD